MFGDPRYVLDRIPAKARVLDVGGGAVPLARANVVLDVVERPTGPVRCIEGTARSFATNEWVTLDANSKAPWPLADKSFDFVFCSHVLEDIRDPLHVCDEIQRVGKAGFIQTPSRAHESTFGIHGVLYPGYMHHRWYLEDVGGVLTMTFKSPILADLPQFACNARGGGIDCALNFWWENAFRAVERPTWHRSQIVEDLARFKAEQDHLDAEWVARQARKNVPPFVDGPLPRFRAAVWRRTVSLVRNARRLV